MSKGLPQKHLFIDRGNDHGSVSLNWVGTPEREFRWYAEYFHAAAKALVLPLRHDPDFSVEGFPPDSFKAVPIVFLYRHALELYLKAILQEGAKIVALRGQVPINIKAVFNSHSLKLLAREVERVFEGFGWGWTAEIPGFSSVAAFRAWIDEFQRVDSGFAFRYPTETDGRTAALDHGFRFNLFELSDRLDLLLPVLNSAADAAHEELQNYYRSGDELDGSN